MSGSVETSFREYFFTFRDCASYNFLPHTPVSDSIYNISVNISTVANRLKAIQCTCLQTKLKHLCFRWNYKTSAVHISFQLITIFRERTRFTLFAQNVKKKLELFCYVIKLQTKLRAVFREF